MNDIVLSEIRACERLMNDTRDDKNVIETEIAETDTRFTTLKRKSLSTPSIQDSRTVDS
jgi:hypothetical protein